MGLNLPRPARTWWLARRIAFSPINSGRPVEFEADDSGRAGALRQLPGADFIIVGKPRPVLGHSCAPGGVLTATRCLIIGDNLESDILGGQRAGDITAAPLLTGVAKREDLLTHNVHPDAVS